MLVIMFSKSIGRSPQEQDSEGCRKVDSFLAFSIRCCIVSIYRDCKPRGQASVPVNSTQRRGRHFNCGIYTRGNAQIRAHEPTSDSN